MACDCVKCLVLKGLACWQAKNKKKVSFMERFLLAIHSCRANVSPLPVQRLTITNDTK